MSQWITIEAERVLSVHHGWETILADDHWPGHRTIVVKLSDGSADSLRKSLTSQDKTSDRSARPMSEKNTRET